MFGLSSREALTSKQQRWTRDIGNTVNTLNDAKTQGLKYDVTMATLPRKSIITYMNEVESESSNDEVITEQFVRLNNRLDDIVSRLLTIEKYQIESRVDIKAILEQPQISETSFTPYFNNEAFIGIDNRSELVGNHLQFNIEIFGDFKDKLIVYPFGSKIVTRDLPDKLTVDVTLEDNIVSVEVTTEKLPNGIYILKLPEVPRQPTKIAYNGLI